MDPHSRPALNEDPDFSGLEEVVKAAKNEIICKGDGWYSCENERDDMESASRIVLDATVLKQYLLFFVELVQVQESIQDGEGSITIKMVSKVSCQFPCYRLGHADGS